MEQIRIVTRSTYDKLDNIFTPKEAWNLYIFIAYAETIGWCLLLFGIISKINKWPLYEWSLSLGGSIHGMIFIAYVLIVLFAHRSMKWSFWQFVWAEALSNVPFGAYAFEQYIVRNKKRH